MSENNPDPIQVLTDWWATVKPAIVEIWQAVVSLCEVIVASPDDVDPALVAAAQAVLDARDAP